MEKQTGRSNSTLLKQAEREREKANKEIKFNLIETRRERERGRKQTRRSNSTLLKQGESVRERVKNKQGDQIQPY
eukprot:596452-Amorphochlora_amoeboformis.AAC.1